jgi:hypothetical protein
VPAWTCELEDHSGRPRALLDEALLDVGAMPSQLSSPRSISTRRPRIGLNRGIGGVAERSKAAVLKTATGLKTRRGFESHPRRL